MRARFSVGDEVTHASWKSPHGGRFKVLEMTEDLVKLECLEPPADDSVEVGWTDWEMPGNYNLLVPSCPF